MSVLCHKDDVFTGFAGAGVIKMPEGKDVPWLTTHCWGCHRSEDEIREADREAGRRTVTA